jgi:hypothetical protein
MPFGFAERPTEPPVSRTALMRQPLPLLASGLAVADVIAPLAEIGVEQPTATVNRGPANRWEIWPGDQSTVCWF